MTQLTATAGPPSVSLVLVQEGADVCSTAILVHFSCSKGNASASWPSATGGPEAGSQATHRIQSEASVVRWNHMRILVPDGAA
jgi:hypothetical protein